MRGVIGHLPAQPVLQGIGAGRAGVFQNVAFMAQPQMLDRVLQLVHRLGQQHRQEPEGHRKPRPRNDRDPGDQRITRQMGAAFKDHARLFFLADERLDNHATGATDHAEDTVAPIGDPRQPQKVGPDRVRLAHQLAVTVPVLGVLVMGEMHDLVIVAREDLDEADDAAEDFIQLAGLEDGRVGQLMLRGIEKVQQDAQGRPGDPDPTGAHGLPMQQPHQQDGPLMAAHLHCALHIRPFGQAAQFIRRQQLSARETGFHFCLLFG